MSIIIIMFFIVFIVIIITIIIIIIIIIIISMFHPAHSPATKLQNIEDFYFNVEMACNILRICISPLK